jgi:membrane-bound inhibitor of C-type lysozyme
MPITLKKSLIAAGLALAAASLCAVPSAFAAEKKPPVKAKASKAKAAPKADGMPDGPDADTTGTTTTDYNCELGNKVTIFHNENDDSHIALRWKKRIHRLDKVGTTTGARRYENPTFGLIWIGIPAKGMLLDSKQNRQLANECKNADQERADLMPVVKQPERPIVKAKEVVEAIPPVMPASAATQAPQVAPPMAPAPAAPVPKAPVPVATAPGAPSAAPVATPPADPAETPPPAETPQDTPVAPETTPPKS